MRERLERWIVRIGAAATLVLVMLVSVAPVIIVLWIIIHFAHKFW